MNYKCPHCGEYIEEDDRIDINIDGDYVECKMVGHCPECERDYTWYELYQYKKLSALLLLNKKISKNY